MAQLRLRRLRDGALRVDSEIPPEHYFSADFIANGIASGEIEVDLRLKTVDGPIEWRLAGLENEDGQRAIGSWHVTRDGDDA